MDNFEQLLGGAHFVVSACVHEKSLLMYVHVFTRTSTLNSAIILCTFVLQDEHFRTAALEKNVRLIVHVHVAVLDMVHPICNMSHRMAVCIVICIVMRKTLYSCDHIFHLQSCDIISSGVCMQVPAIMGMLGVWYNNFFGAQSHALLPYDQVISWMSTYTIYMYMYIELCMPEPRYCLNNSFWLHVHFYHWVTWSLVDMDGWSFYPKAQVLLGMLVIYHRCKMFHPFSFHTVSAQVCSLFSAGKTTVMYILHLECMWYIPPVFARCIHTCTCVQMYCITLMTGRHGI